MKLKENVFRPLVVRLGSIAAGAIIAAVPALEGHNVEAVIVAIALIGVDLALEAYNRRV